MILLDDIKRALLSAEERKMLEGGGMKDTFNLLREAIVIFDNKKAPWE